MAAEITPTSGSDFVYLMGTRETGHYYIIRNKDLSALIDIHALPDTPKEVVRKAEATREKVFLIFPQGQDRHFVKREWVVKMYRDWPEFIERMDSIVSSVTRLAELERGKE